MSESLSEKLKKLEIIAENSPGIDKRFCISMEEFVQRRQKVFKAVTDMYDVDVAFAFSDEHYCGDVPYLGGNTNYSVEQIAFGLGPDPATSGIIAGFEGIYIAGQLAPRADVAIYPTESLQLADEVYPVEGFSLKDILTKIAGREVSRIGLLTPRQVVPAGIVANLEDLVGKANVIDTQVPFQKVKNLKSDNEMRLLKDSAYVTSLASRAMLAVTEPGMDETEVAAFGDMLGKWMGCERKGFETMACGDVAVITMIAPALNRTIQDSNEAAVPMLFGTSYKRDGLAACCRRSAFSNSKNITPYQQYFTDLVEQAFRVGFDSYVDIVSNNKPAKLQEQSMIDFFNDKTDETIEIVEKYYGKEKATLLKEKLNEDIPGVVKGLARMKPYTGTHNAGYTECQEFYGAITLESEEPLDRQVVTMLDVALRGRGSRWLGEEFEQVIYGFDYWVVEDTLGKFGDKTVNLTGQLQAGGQLIKGIGKIPINVQALIGNVDEYQK